MTTNLKPGKESSSFRDKKWMEEVTRLVKRITGTVTGTNTGDVTLAGAPTYLTIAGQVITRALINLTSHVTGVLDEMNGGTGQSTFTQGDLLYSDASNQLAKLAKNTSDARYLSNQGGSNNPAWAQVKLDTGVTGTLPIANGGTGQSTGRTSFTPANLTPTAGTVTGGTKTGWYMRTGDLIYFQASYVGYTQNTSTSTSYTTDLPITASANNIAATPLTAYDASSGLMLTRSQITSTTQYILDRSGDWTAGQSVNLYITGWYFVS